MRRARTDETLAVAFHEAGHALAGVRWAGSLQDVTIVPTAGHGGRVRIWSSGLACGPDQLAAILDGADEDEARVCVARILAHVRYYLAGAAAESLYLGRRSEGALDRRDPDAECARVLVDVLCTESMAPCLLWHEYRRTCRFLRANWLHVDAVAGALLRHGTLGQRRFYAVLDALPAMRERGRRER